ncbi:hypothetical protein H0B56_12160 [Haloechinothrix sp. YIM 98757]|uniref:Uncharacterized protein n=1 Tax=Haloechinothrix aidingensis TaxID=2752311 RepID=A0A838AAQ3_9PSEU|nr:hypothetical protein [Haloechinothrix aidingensis]MBA0126296.1 hypothetical protein [Haloechinothrix aidingensis]
MRRALITASALAALAVAGCSSDEPADTDSTGDTNPAPATSEAPEPWTEEQIATHLDLTPTETEGSYTYGDACQIPVIMTTPQEVELYAEAGDTVATTPDGTAGVKIVGDCEPDVSAQLEDITR